MTPLPALVVVGPLLAAALIAGTGAWLSRRAVDLIAFAVSAADAYGCWRLVWATSTASIEPWTGGWVLHGSGVLGIRMLAEPLGAGLAMLAAVLVSATFVFSWRYFEEVSHAYAALMLVLLGGLAGVSMAADFFNLFVFLEVGSVAAYALTAYKIEQSSLVGALNFALTNTIGGVFVLIGIALVYARTGVLDLRFAGARLGPADPLVTTALALTLTGFFVKAAVAPFHFWLPDTYAAAPTPVVVLFGGVMLEVGLFAAARVYWLAFSPALHEPHALVVLLVTAGLLTAGIAAGMALLQRSFKRMLAFVAVSHSGLFLAGIGLLDAGALGGVGVSVLAHGLLMGALFLCAGILRQRLRTEDEIDGFGAGRSLAGVGVIIVVAALALSAPPRSGMHLGESLIEEHALARGWTAMVCAFVFATAATSGAILRAAGRIFAGWGRPGGIESTGPRDDSGDDDEDARGRGRGFPWLMAVPAAALAAAGAALGVAPSLGPGAVAAASQLSATPVAAVPPEPAWLPWAAPVGACLVAAIALWRDRLPYALSATARRAVRRGVTTLQRAHSPHAGDHIGWLTLGAALIAAVLNYFVR
jgi:multicomponent Na+:H+ antiporter subunit D